jgi:imidazolonepropionase-like amidohydrolase
VAQVDSVWPLHIKREPDFVKVFLLFSEEYAKRLHDSVYFGRRGLDPTLVPYITAKAHRSGLRVTAHVETAADFRVAVDAGVDEIGHVPGFRPDGNTMSAFLPLDRYRLTPQDAAQAARRGVVVVTTVSEALELLGDPATISPESAAPIKQMLLSNLVLLRDAGVKIALGSDRFRLNVVREVDALAAAGVFDNLSLLRMWSVTTPQTIFPARRIGSLADGSEASLLVLSGDPIADIGNTKRIVLRMKQGHLIREQ